MADGADHALLTGFGAPVGHCMTMYSIRMQDMKQLKAKQRELQNAADARDFDRFERIKQALEEMEQFAVARGWSPPLRRA